MNRQKYNPSVHAMLLALVGGYILFIAWRLFDSMRSGAGEMSDALYILLTVFFALAGCGVLFYAFVTWRRADKAKKPEENDNPEANKIEPDKNENEQITRTRWRQSQARLHITNDTGKLWQSPTIRYIFGQNWGGDNLEDKKTLPALEVGASADFVIPFDIYELSDNERLSAYLQIYLEGDESKMNEHYWCVWFDIVD